MIAIEGRTAGPRRREHERLRWAIAFRTIAAFGMVAVALATTARAEALRWKFKAGEVLHYSVESDVRGNVKLAEREQKSNRSQTIDMTWTVQNVDANGVAVVAQRTERVRMKVDAPPYQAFEFDSARPGKPQAGFEDHAKQLQAMVGTTFTFHIKPSGEIADLQFPEETLKKLRDAAPREANDAELTEKALKDMLLQSSPPRFPDGDVAPGQTWKSKPTRMFSGFATLVLANQFTLRGPDPQTPGALLVDTETKVTLEPVEGVTAVVRRQEGKGTMVFNARTGRLVRSKQTQTLDVGITAGGQAVEQSTESTSTMSLAP